MTHPKPEVLGTFRGEQQNRHPCGGYRDTVRDFTFTVYRIYFTLYVQSGTKFSTRNDFIHYNKQYIKHNYIFLCTSFSEEDTYTQGHTNCLQVAIKTLQFNTDWGGWTGSPGPLRRHTSGCIWCGKCLVVVPTRWQEGLNACS